MMPKPIIVVPGSIPRMIRSFSTFRFSLSILKKARIHLSVLSKVAKALFLLFVLFYIYEKVFQENTLLSWFGHLSNLTSSTQSIGLFLLSLGLLFVNWSLEARKWQISIQSLAMINFRSALKAVFAGVSTSIITPNRVGEFLGKIVFLKYGTRTAGAGLSFVNSTAQLFITFLAGAIALSSGCDSMVASSGLLSYLQMMEGLVWILTILLAVLYFFMPSLLPLLKNIKLLKRYTEDIQQAQMPSFNVLLHVLVLSGFRYAVFSLQYIILLSLLTSDLNLEMAIRSLPLMYLALAIAPTISFGELGMREYLALNVLFLASSDELGIFLASSILWIVNIAFPALLGAFFLQSAKIVEE